MRSTLKTLIPLLALAFSSALVTAADNDVESEDTVLRDPTRPLGFVANTGAEGDKSWHLNSVLISNSRKVAVINGQSVKERGWINGAQVTQIQSGKVTLLVDGEKRVLTTRTNIRKTKVEG